MEDFWFYIQLGLDHVLDINAYDHVLFLIALALPFTFKSWRTVVFLATLFTIAHCLSLILSSYNVLSVDVALIEFFIPITIVVTAVFNMLYAKLGSNEKNIWPHSVATVIFGLIHGFGFSTYFKMLMAEEHNKLCPLMGFALGIEISQVIIVLSVLILSFFLTSFTKLKHISLVFLLSVLIILLTIPLLIETFPYGTQY
ncbi:MAG TPA: HupE/UreJ family protein [Pricia antarctica]|uniref:HupE/UreJ family protein n=1 Tax=Pricia antarctica TaxID=641691 RepID=A0A831QTZ7_9FLAO|nr:HupE/UreJ family protein [Pricia antarctica]